MQRLRLLLLLALTCPACAPPQWCVPEPLYRVPWIDESADPAGHVMIDGENLRALAGEAIVRAAAFHPQPTQPYHLLVLSGGGFQGAFGAGILKGWSDSGCRPMFDVVTGVSTGAIIATFAFLGPQYDDLLRENMIGVVKRDILQKRGPLALFFRDGLNSTDRLEERINEGITPEILAQVAEAHAAGRRLYVATTNLDTGRLVIWNMGAIASRGDTEALHLYRKIILASSAIPGAMPPVRLPIEVNGQCYIERHVDGAAAGELVYRPFMVADLNRLRGCHPPHAHAPPGSRLYVIINGKLYADPKCARPRVIGILSDSTGTVLYNKTRDEMHRVYLHCLQTGVRFQAIEVPSEVKISRGALRVTPEEQQLLYDLGYERGQRASSAVGWRDVPPDTAPDEQEIPRSGTRFSTGENPRIVEPTPLLKDAAELK